MIRLVEQVVALGRGRAQRLRVGQQVRVAHQLIVLARPGIGAGQLVTLELEQGFLSLPRLGCVEQGLALAPQAVVGGPGPAIRLERLVQRAEGVQQVALAVGIEQGPSLVLAVDVDHLLAQALKSRDRHGHPVDLGGAAALRGDSSRDDQRVLVEHPAEDCFELSAQRLVLDFEDCRSPGLRLARADQVGRGLPSKNQPERREQQALPRPGLPRPGAEPPLQLDLHVLDQCQVLYRKLSQHDERASERLSEPFRSRAQCPVTNRFVPFILRFLGQPSKPPPGREPSGDPSAVRRHFLNFKFRTWNAVDIYGVDCASAGQRIGILLIFLS